MDHSMSITFTHTVAVLLLVSRLADVLSTRLVTPTLRLEANPFVRQLGWRFAVSSLLLALIPYFMLPVGIAILAASLLVSASNFSRGWLAHAVGEDTYEELLMRAGQTGRRRTALDFVLTGGGFACLAGLILMWLSGSQDHPAHWFGFGIVVYGGAVAGYGYLFVARTFERAGSGSAAS